MFSLTPVVKNLVIINVVVYGLQLLIPSVINLDFTQVMGMHYFMSEKFRVWQIITYMFCHSTVGFSHILFNMIGLAIFGPLLEQSLGQQRFFIFYMVCGVGAGLLFTGVHHFELMSIQNDLNAFLSNPGPENFEIYLQEHFSIQYQNNLNFIDQFYDNPNSGDYIGEARQFALKLYDESSDFTMVGASGAIFGVLIAFGLLFPNLQLMLIFPPIPVKAKYMVGFYALVEIFQGLRPVPGDNVAHFAHLGGMLIGLIMIKLVYKINTPRMF